MLTNKDWNDCYRFALSLSGKEEQAYDLLQESLLRFLEKDPWVLNKKAYIKKIIRNLFYDNVKHQKIKDQNRADLELDYLLRLERDFEKISLQRDEINNLLDKIEPYQREILFLWAVEGKKTREIAKELGKSNGSICSNLDQIRKKIKKED